MKSKKNCYIAFGAFGIAKEGLMSSRIEIKAGSTSGSPRIRMSAHKSQYFADIHDYSGNLGADHLIYQKSFIDSSSREQVLINSVRKAGKVLKSLGYSILLHHADKGDKRSNPAPWVTKVDSRIVNMLIKKVSNHYEEKANKSTRELATLKANIAKLESQAYRDQKVAHSFARKANKALERVA